MSPFDLIQRDLDVLGPIGSAVVLGAPVVALYLVIAGWPFARAALAVYLLALAG